MAAEWLLAFSLIAATGVASANADATGVTAAPIRKDRVVLLDVALAGKRVVAVGERGVVLGSDDDGKT